MILAELARHVSAEVEKIRQHMRIAEADADETIDDFRGYSGRLCIALEPCFATWPGRQDPLPLTERRAIAERVLYRAVGKGRPTYGDVRTPHQAAVAFILARYGKTVKTESAAESYILRGSEMLDLLKEPEPDPKETLSRTKPAN